MFLDSIALGSALDCAAWLVFRVGFCVGLPSIRFKGWEIVHLHMFKEHVATFQWDDSRTSSGWGSPTCEGRRKKKKKEKKY
mmetsp:Transcript_25780/g.38357  ORF Transcript_25780/g.38357 Transcript_25780/m.38357 type:complete len:81 (-) Transcript_25780:14-256(-)